MAAALVMASVGVAVWCARLSPPELEPSQDATEAVLPPSLDAEPVSLPPTGDEAGGAAPCRGEVLVIAAHEDPRHSTASVLMPDGNTDIWHTGQSVAGFVVDAIHYDRVSLRRGAQTCQLYIGERPTPVTASVESRPGLPEWLAPHVELDAEEILVPRDMVGRIFEEAGALIAGTRAVRVGDGLRLSRVEGVLQTLGFDRGDVLHSVNGFQLNDPQKMLEAFAKLQSADHLVLSFSRGNKRAELDVRVI